MFKAMLKENYYPYEDIYGSIASGVLGLATAGLNYGVQSGLMKQDREANYKYNEMAASNADARTRALYRDIYSPEALLGQYREAGLSPSMMYGGTPGQGGMSGAQGAGSNGPTTPYYPVNMLEMAQAANLMAQTKKTEAETTNINKDTDLKVLEEQLKTMTNDTYKTEWRLLNTSWIDPETGQPTSLYEIAGNCYSFDQFLKEVREGAKRANDSELSMMTGTETGMNELRSIYIANERFHRDIEVLNNEEVSTRFKTDITRIMNEKGFKELHVDAALEQLKAIKSSSELTTEQKEAWNNLISKLGKKGSTMRDVIVVLGMILSQSMTGKNLPGF